MMAFLESDTFATVMGGIIILFLLALVWKVGPLRVLGDILGHAAVTAGFIILAVLTFLFFAETGIGQRLGGVETGLYVVFIGPFVLLALSLLAAFVWPRKRSDGKDTSDDN